MENKDFFQQYNITSKQYENIKNVLDDPDDVEMVSLLSSLNKLQFSEEEINLFVKYPISLQKDLLKKQRIILLDKAHEYYKLVDLLDDMIYEMKNKGDK